MNWIERYAADQEKEHMNLLETCWLNVKRKIHQQQRMNPTIEDEGIQKVENITIQNEVNYDT